MGKLLIAMGFLAAISHAVTVIYEPNELTDEIHVYDLEGDPVDPCPPRYY